MASYASCQQSALELREVWDTHVDLAALPV
jgi:hypothetical protein